MSLLFSEIKTAACVARDAAVRDWQATSWMFPDNPSHPVATLGAALAATAGESGGVPPALDPQFLQDGYTAAKEGKLQAWERASTRAIEQWSPRQIAKLIAIFPACVPKECAGCLIEVRQSKDDWLVDFSVPPPIAVTRELYGEPQYA